MESTNILLTTPSVQAAMAVWTLSEGRNGGWGPAFANSESEKGLSLTIVFPPGLVCFWGGLAEHCRQAAGGSTHLIL